MALQAEQPVNLLRSRLHVSRLLECLLYVLLTVQLLFFYHHHHHHHHQDKFTNSNFSFPKQMKTIHTFYTTVLMP